MKTSLNPDDQQALAIAVGLAGPGDLQTARERRLWCRLAALQAAVLRVLSDVDDDGVAEGQDLAIAALRSAASN